ncbi:MAG: response regulator [Rubrivivax sp.]
MREKLILLVEDNPDDVELTLAALARSAPDGEVVVARDGAEAIAYLSASSAAAAAPAGPGAARLPAVLVLDLNLPKVSGLDVLRHVRADPRTRLLPVVVLTTSLEEQDVRSSYEFGANAYVRKPVAYEQFADVARQIGAFWTGLNVRAPVRGAAG